MIIMKDKNCNRCRKGRYKSMYPLEDNVICPFCKHRRNIYIYVKDVGKEINGKTWIPIKIVPNCKVNETFSITDDNKIEVKIKENSSLGKADIEAIKFFSDKFNLKEKEIDIINGKNSKDKHLVLNRKLSEMADNIL